MANHNLWAAPAVELKKKELKLTSVTIQTWQYKASPEPQVRYLAKEGAGAGIWAGTGYRCR